MYRFTHKKKEKKSFSDTWYGTAIIFIAIMFIVGQCSDASGPQYPLDPSNTDAEYQADMSEQDNRNYDPGEGYVVEPLSDPVDPDESSDSTACSIKGNISLDGEKIYHIPGQEFYDATEIDPAYGERWFCTEAEARAAGWRKSQR